MISYKGWDAGESGQEGKSLGDVGALELGPGRLKAAFIWSQRLHGGGVE